MKAALFIFIPDITFLLIAQIPEYFCQYGFQFIRFLLFRTFVTRIRNIKGRSKHVSRIGTCIYILPSQLLTNKPVLYVCNVDEASVVDGNKYVDAVREAVKNENAEVLIIGAGIEADIAELETYEEKQMFLEDLGLKEAGVNKLIRTAYHLLNLQTYFTAGPKEVRAWTFRKGMKAPQTAGIIHTDFEKGFIRAEVIKYEDFVHYGSETKCKEAGKMSGEGKDYVVQDGDMMNFRFNV